MNTLAITGGTGFVGARLIDLAVAQGHGVRALTRRPQPQTDGVTWVEGDLATPAALAALVRGSNAVIHVAGIVNAPDRETFEHGNVAGTGAILDATTNAGISRFIHISSLSAREPQLSLYGGSKHRAEQLVMASDRDWTIVRPPAIYGPGDMEMREMFRMAKLGVVFLPPPGKLSVIHVDDLARLLLALALSDTAKQVFEPDDGTAGGWTHEGFARAIGRAVGQSAMTMALPRPLLSLAARIDRLARGKNAKLTSDRVAYFCHPDWTANPDRRPPATLWQPGIAASDGLAQTATWYRAHALL